MGLDSFRSLRAACVVSTVAVAFSACQEPTQITLEITTDVDCMLRPETAIVVGSANAESPDPGTVTEMCKDGRIGAIVLLPKSAKNERISVRVAMGIGSDYTAEDCLKDPSLQDDVVKDAKGNVLNVGCIIARRTLSFIPSTPLFLPIKMRGECIGEPCDLGQTCVRRGECTSDVINSAQECSEGDVCELPGETSDGGTPDSGKGGAGGNGNTSSSSSSGKGGAGGIMMDGGNAGGFAGSGGMGGMGTGGTGGFAGMAGSGGTGGPSGPGSSSTSSSSGGMGGMGGTGAAGGMGGMGGMGGVGGTLIDDGGMGSTSSSTSSGFLMDGGTTTMEAGVTGDNSDLASQDEMLIAPGTLVPGQRYTGPVRRKRVLRIPPLRLPLNTHPRNVKP